MQASKLPLLTSLGPEGHYTQIIEEGMLCIKQPQIEVWYLTRITFPGFEKHQRGQSEHVQMVLDPFPC